MGARRPVSLLRRLMLALGLAFVLVQLVLTGYNYARFKHSVSDHAALLKLAESQTAHRPCAIITIDIDHFKRVNDAYGHGAGDTVLRRVADIIKAPLRPNTDIGARMGGEEFTVLLPDTDTESAIAFAEKLRRRVEQTVVVVGENEIRPTISLGVALNRKTADLDDLIDRADRALYTAKRTGRNKVATEVDVQAGAPASKNAAA